MSEIPRHYRTRYCGTQLYRRRPGSGLRQLALACGEAVKAPLSAGPAKRSCAQAPSGPTLAQHDILGERYVGSAGQDRRRVRLLLERPAAVEGGGGWVDYRC